MWQSAFQTRHCWRGLMTCTTNKSAKIFVTGVLISIFFSFSFSLGLFLVHDQRTFDIFYIYLFSELDSFSMINIQWQVTLSFVLSMAAFVIIIYQLNTFHVRTHDQSNRYTSHSGHSSKLRARFVYCAGFTGLFQIIAGIKSIFDRILYICHNVNPLPHIHDLKRPHMRSLLKTLWKKEKMLVTSIFSFSHNVFYPFKNKFQFSARIYFLV